jgi:polyhydroxyalkanoate synthesis regulator phasin
MSSPLLQAFFVGRAISEVLYERAEASFTDALSELGKLDAELREQSRDFVNQVMERAAREQEIAARSRTGTTTVVTVDTPTGDLQATIDDLRAEIAELRSALQQYRAQANN